MLLLNLVSGEKVFLSPKLNIGSNVFSFRFEFLLEKQEIISFSDVPNLTNEQIDSFIRKLPLKQSYIFNLAMDKWGIGYIGKSLKLNKRY